MTKYDDPLAAINEMSATRQANRQRTMERLFGPPPERQPAARPPAADPGPSSTAGTPPAETTDDPRIAACRAAGIPEAFASRLNGDTTEALFEDAASLVDVVGPPPPRRRPDPAQGQRGGANLRAQTGNERFREQLEQMREDMANRDPALWVQTGPRNRGGDK